MGEELNNVRTTISRRKDYFLKIVHLRPIRYLYKKSRPLVSDTLMHMTEPHTELKAELIKFFGGVLLPESLKEIVLVY